jgi:hypothetical protein
MRRQHRQIPPRAHEHVQPAGGQMRIGIAEPHILIVTRLCRTEYYSGMAGGLAFINSANRVSFLNSANSGSVYTSSTFL